MGIRIPMGASAREIRCLVLGQAARLAVSGVVVGLLAALFVTPLLSSLLFGVDARVQPLEALHYE